MLVVQENCKLRSYGLAFRCDCLLKQMILHLLGQIAPYPNNSLAQSARKLLCDHAGSWIGGWHFCYSRRRTPRPLLLASMNFTPHVPVPCGWRRSLHPTGYSPDDFSWIMERLAKIEEAINRRAA